MSEGYVLFATFAVPLGTMVLLVLIPSRLKLLVRLVATAAATAMFGLSVYAFVRYHFNGGDPYDPRFDLRFDWISNVGMLNENGITLHLGMDGIAALMILLTGIVILAGTLVSWKIERRNKDFFILLFMLVAGV